MIVNIMYIYFYYDGVMAYLVKTCWRMHLGCDRVMPHPTRHYRRRLSNVAGNFKAIMSPIYHLFNLGANTRHTKIPIKFSWFYTRIIF